MSGDSVLSKSPHFTNSIYALTNNDGLGAQLTHVVLKGANYEEWAKGFRIGLGAKRKLCFIDGTLKTPTDSADIKEWKTFNYTVIAWIFNIIDPTLRSKISYHETAFELRADIRERFSLGNGVKIYQLRSAISDCKQQTEESIMAYFGRLKKLWDDVNDFDALPYCSCSGCSCGLNTNFQKRRDT
ncbi:hypothetical protein vseg_003617 [Gypsophila vaccaria]